MTVLSEVLAANGQYAADFGKKGELALPPTRRFAILTCMGPAGSRQIRRAFGRRRACGPQRRRARDG